MAELDERLRALDPARRSLLLRRLREAQGRTTADDAPQASEQSWPAPLSFAQERLWFLEKMRPQTATYNVPVVTELGGRVETAALQRALDQLLARHQVLCCRIVETPAGTEQVLVPSARIELRVIDLKSMSPAEREAEAERRIALECASPFSLGEAPLIRAMLVVLDERRSRLALTLHHIACDGWSLEILYRELAQLYGAELAGQAVRLPPLELQYGDYARWQRTRLRGERLEQLVEHWRLKLADAPTLIDLPTDRPRPKVQGNWGELYEFELAAPQAASLKVLGQRQQCTSFMTLLAVYATLLHKLTGQSDLVIGSPVANRERAELQGLIGLFVNTVPIRLHVEREQGFDELLVQVRRSALDAFAHAELPFERLVEALRPVRTLAHSPIFQVTFGLQGAASDGAATTGSGAGNGTTKFELTLAMREVGSKLGAVFEFNRDLFDRSSIEGFARLFGRIVDQVCADPKQPLANMSLLSASERAWVRERSRATERSTAFAPSLHEWVAHWALATPSACAIEDAARRWSYAELHARAQRCAVALHGRGLAAGATVAVMAGRGSAGESIAALLAIQALGCVYLPLDPELPEARKALIVSDASPALIIAADPADLGSGGWPTVTVAELDEAIPDGWSSASSGDDAPSYIIYTSGSTGIPKGVRVLHRGLRNVLAAQRELLSVDSAHRVLGLSSRSFDASLFEFGLAFGAGACLVLRPAAELLPGAALARTLDEARIGVMVIPPSSLAAMPERSFPSLQLLIAAGEACPQELVRRFGVGRSFFNAYGPTEASIWSTLQACDAEDSVDPAIGRPIPGVRVYVLDDAGQPVPPGVKGEIYLGGAGVADGYHRREELNERSFVVAQPFPEQASERLYRSGDLGRWRADGSLEFLGRRDGQLKLRGYRIETGEVHAVLVATPGVREACVDVERRSTSDARLVAYLVLEPGLATQPAELRHRLREQWRAKLPEYMVPSQVVLLDEMPRTVSGKLDRQALSARSSPEMRSAEQAPPTTPTQAALVRIWAALLASGEPGVEDDFFALGGHSLLLTQLASRIFAEFSLELGLTQLFDHPTIALQATLIDELGSQRSGAAPEVSSAIRRVARNRVGSSRGLS